MVVSVTTFFSCAQPSMEKNTTKQETKKKFPFRDSNSGRVDENHISWPTRLNGIVWIVEETTLKILLIEIISCNWFRGMQVAKLRYNSMEQACPYTQPLKEFIENEPKNWFVFFDLLNFLSVIVWFGCQRQPAYHHFFIFLIRFMAAKE